MNSECALLVFAKAPVTGEVKTRLIPEIGGDRATALYEELLTETLDVALKTKLQNIQLWISGDREHPYFISLKSRKRFTFYSQSGKGLGERMFNAFDSALSQYPYVVLIGSDCPELLSSDIQSAMNSLKSGKDLVLGPAEDGGYYLIGLKMNYVELFSGISWGKKDVFADTVSKANKLNLKVTFLSKRRDVDCVADLESYIKLKKEGALN